MLIPVKCVYLILRYCSNSVFYYIICYKYKEEQAIYLFVCIGHLIKPSFFFFSHCFPSFTAFFGELSKTYLISESNHILLKFHFENINFVHILSPFIWWLTCSSGCLRLCSSRQIWTKNAYAVILPFGLLSFASIPGIPNGTIPVTPVLPGRGIICKELNWRWTCNRSWNSRQLVDFNWLSLFWLQKTIIVSLKDWQHNPNTLYRAVTWTGSPGWTVTSTNKLY